MRLRYKILLALVIVVGCAIAVHKANRPLPTVKGPAQISYQHDTIVVKQKGKKDIKVYQPDPKSTVISTDAQGNVTVKVKQAGFGFDPGIGFGVSDRARIALDARFAFYKRFGAHTGIGLSLTGSDYSSGRFLHVIDPYLGLGYTPFDALPNTSLVGGYAFGTKHPFVFVRWRF